MTNKAVRNIAPVRGKKQKISVVIVAAGAANRMKSYEPRSLIRITPDSNLILYQLNIINENIPNSEVVLVCGCEADKLMNNTPSTIIKVQNERFDTTNVVRSIGLGLRAATGDSVLLIYGDLLFNDAALRNARLESSSIFIDDSGLLPQSCIGCTFNEQEIAEYMLFDLPNKWAQIAFFTDRELQLLKQVVWNRDKDNLFGFEAINEVINKGGVLRKQSPKNMKVIDIDSSKDLQLIKEVI